MQLKLILDSAAALHIKLINLPMIESEVGREESANILKETNEIVGISLSALLANLKIAFDDDFSCSRHLFSASRSRLDLES